MPLFTEMEPNKLSLGALKDYELCCVYLGKGDVADFLEKKEKIFEKMHPSVNCFWRDTEKGEGYLMLRRDGIEKVPILIFLQVGKIVDPLTEFFSGRQEKILKRIEESGIKIFKKL